MISNIDDKLIKSANGRKHFDSQKKTSLYGSESPRDSKTRNYKHRYSQPRNVITHGDGNIIHESDLYRKQDGIQSHYQSDMAEKMANLEEIKNYNKWAMPNNGMQSINQFDGQPRNRLLHEYEKQSKEAMEKQDTTFPGFGSGFGSGQGSKENKRQSDQESSNPVSSFQSLGLKKFEVDHDDDNKEKDSSYYYKNYEEAKSYAEYLEKEIQRLKMKQHETYNGDYLKNNHESNYNSLERDNQMRLNEAIYNGNNDATKNNDRHYISQEDREDMFRPNDKANYENSDLLREADVRARLRELDRMKDAYGTNGSNINEDLIKAEINRDDYYDREQQNDDGDDKFRANKQSMSQMPQNQQKRINSSNKNDYRKYTLEEYMNSRPLPSNYSSNKRTTLSGSEDIDNEKGMQLIDEKDVSQKHGRKSTHDNIFPLNGLMSPSNSSMYKMKAPFATD